MYTPQDYINLIDLVMIADKWMMEDCDVDNDYCEGAMSMGPVKWILAI